MILSMSCASINFHRHHLKYILRVHRMHNSTVYLTISCIWSFWFFSLLLALFHFVPFSLLFSLSLFHFHFNRDSAPKLWDIARVLKYWQSLLFREIFLSINFGCWGTSWQEKIKNYDVNNISPKENFESCLHMSVFVCMCICVHAYAYVLMCMCVCTCIYMHLCVCKCVCVYVHACVW